MNGHGKGRRRACTWIATGLLLLAAGSAQADAAPPRDDVRVRAEVGAAMESLIRAAGTLDAEKALAVLSDDADAVFFFDGRPYGKRQLIDALKTIYASLQSMRIRMVPPVITVLGPDAAVWAASGTATSVDKAGRTFVETLRETWVWQRRGGVWRVAHSHEAVAMTPAGNGT